MSGNHFRFWLEDEANLYFWKKPIASRSIDQVIANKQIQKSIVNSSDNQRKLSFIESQIASDYARMIDFKLREVYQSFTLEEFKNPTGFEKKERSNLLQQKYFQTRGHIEYFLKTEIQGNPNGRDAQLNAFRRWINIADLLLRKHCYEGFLLVIVNLELISNNQLLYGLPSGVRKNFLRLCELSKPDSNHLSLRQHMSLNQNEKDFTPLLFNYHAIALLNESLDNLVNLRKDLNKKNTRISRLISKIEQRMDIHTISSIRSKSILNLPISRKATQKHSRYIGLVKKLDENQDMLTNIDLQISDQLSQRKAILRSIKQEQQESQTELPRHLARTFKAIGKEHDNYEIEQVAYPELEKPVVVGDKKPSTLYKSNLLPGFWSRKGKTPETYWDEFFIPSVLKGR